MIWPFQSNSDQELNSTATILLTTIISWIDFMSYICFSRTCSHIFETVRGMCSDRPVTLAEIGEVNYNGTSVLKLYSFHKAVQKLNQPH